MAIQFARVEYVGRSSGGNACCKGAYNARVKIVDGKTGTIYNFERKGDNVYHKVFLAEGVDQKFYNPAILMNEVERSEGRKNSSLLKDIVIALPDDKELDLQDRINISHLIINKMQWVREGLGVQLDIHEPHDGEKNWHAHILLTLRRFAECGTKLGAKARDLDIQVRGGVNPFGIAEEQMIHEVVRDVINDYFKELGLENRVDAIGINPGEHIGPIRMRSVLNQAVERNEERRIAEVEHLSDGVNLLEKVTRHMSVFSRGDLARAAKCIPDRELTNKLVEEALLDKRVIELFDESGRGLDCYTTDYVREDELKLLRLSSYIAKQKNLLLSGSKLRRDKIASLIEQSKDSLTAEQHTALSNLLLEDLGIRILRGRAGTGKSHVLGRIASISKECGVEVIGIAPTHKAKGELTKCGFEQVDTVKGMLFKLYNGRFELPKNSLIVVDEGGMVGNDDYLELLRIAASRKCNVILSGDERQLALVQRGGMFEIFADRYGSSHLFDIKRQDTQWGKSVAMAFSKGEVRSGVQILEDNNKIKNSADKIASIEALLSDWNKSKQELDNKIIIAVANKDAAALNHGAREYLKASGKLLGPEIEVGDSHYMKGDRILIKQTDKELGLVNGDIAKLTFVSKERFIVQNMQGQEISFDPSEYSAFRHGYATTVFKAQGMSINDVFVLHDGFGTIRNSYVALSRNIKDLKLYINSSSTKSMNHLVKQLSNDPDSSSSLSYFTKEELAKNKLQADFDANKGIFASIVVGALDYGLKKLTEYSDKRGVEEEYYQYQAASIKREKVEEVLDTLSERFDQERMPAVSHNYGSVKAVGEDIVTPNIIDNRISINTTNTIINTTIKGSKYHSPTTLDQSKVCHVNNYSTQKISSTNSLNEKNTKNEKKLSAKEQFYAKADYKRTLLNQEAIREQWDKEGQNLRAEVKFKAEQIARNLLGEPNKRLSNGKTLRFGEHGRLAVRISGEKLGSWYDFSSDRGGDMFALVQERRGGSFKDAADYLRSSLGIESATNYNHLRLVYDHNNRNLTESYIKEREAEERAAKAKQEQVIKLYARSKEIGDTSTAVRYLSKHRNITCFLSSDIRTAGMGIAVRKAGGMVEKEVNEAASEYGKKKYYPALIAFARDREGNITGGQQILLDGKTGAKAAIDVPKKSFGKIAGSFVDVGEIGKIGSDSNAVSITVIAEGLETALSVKQAFIAGNSGYAKGYASDRNRDPAKDHDSNKINAKILCSLGISNIGNYQPYKGEKIIIAADNDGEHSITNKTIENAKANIEKLGGFVEIVRPNMEGDFNDVLKASEIKQIQESFKGAINLHSAKTLEEYLGYRAAKELQVQDSADIEQNRILKDNAGQNHLSNGNLSSDVLHNSVLNNMQNNALDKQDRENLAYIEHYSLNQERLIDAWRANVIKGKIALDLMRKEINAVEHQLQAQDTRDILDTVKSHSVKIDETSLVRMLVAEANLTTGRNNDIKDVGYNHGSRTMNKDRATEDIPVKDIDKNINTAIKELSTALVVSYCISHGLEQFAEQKQLGKTSEEIFDIIHKEDQFLTAVGVGITLHDQENLDDNLKTRVELSQSGESKKIIEEIKQGLEANYKQDIVSDSELSKALLSSNWTNNPQNIASSLNELAKSGRAKHLGAISLQLSELDKLAYKCDKDALVNTLKSMTYEEKQAYINKILITETKRYVEPMVVRYVGYREEAAKSGDFSVFLKTMMHEQEMFADLYARHNMAIYAVDKHNGNIKLSALAKSAYDLREKITYKEVTKIIDYGIKHKITTPSSIINELKNNEGNLNHLYDSLKYKCHNHEIKLAQNKQLSNAASSGKEHESDKQPPINHKEMSGPNL